MDNKYLKNCNFVKTVLMLIIVFYHSILFWSGGWFTANPSKTYTWVTILTKWLNSFHIYAFAFVSGFIFYYLKHELNRYNDTKKFITNKVNRLLVPYAFCLIVWVIPIQYFFLRYDFGVFIKQYVLGTNPNQLWFLLMLFWVYLIFYFLSDFFKNKQLGGAILALGFYGAGIVLGKFIPNVFMIWTAFKYVPIFYLGFKLKQYDENILYKVPTALWLVVDVALFVVKLYLPSEGAIFTVMHLALDFALNAVGAFMAFFVLQKLANFINKDSKTVKFLSQHSFGIYLFHQQVIYFAIHWLNGVISPIVIMLISIVVAFTVSLCITNLMLRFNTTRLLIGEKKIEAPKQT